MKNFLKSIWLKLMPEKRVGIQCATPAIMSGELKVQYKGIKKQNAPKKKCSNYLEPPNWL